jgi:hypothetical protein
MERSPPRDFAERSVVPGPSGYFTAIDPIEVF